MTTKNDLEKKQSIKEGARDLFFRFGYSKTSMEDIAQQCGLAKPTLYYYYSNKESIFNEIVIEEAELFMNNIEKKIPKDKPADVKIAAFFHFIYDDLKIYAAEMAEVPEMMCNHSPHGKPIVEKINYFFEEKLRPLLSEGKEQGILAFDDEEGALTALSHMTHFLNLDWMRVGDEEQRNKIVKITTSIILNGLRRRDK